MKKWLIMGMSVWGLLGVLNVYCKSWTALTAIATWILAGGVFFAILQVYQARKSTNAQIAMELFRELRNEKALRMLRSIYNLRPGENIAILPQGLRDNIDFILDRLQLLGHLVRRGIIDKSLAIEGFGGPAILRCWFQLGQYIHAVQKERGYYVEDYESLVSDCLKYFADRNIGVTFRNRRDVYVQNLVDELQKDKLLRPRTFKEIEEDRKMIGKDK